MVYTLGFLFNEDFTKVALIEKQHPEWQKGRLNGIGGKMELLDNDPTQAMIREFEEETGFKFLNWGIFALMQGDGWIVYCFKGTTKDLEVCQTITDEEVKIINISNLHYEKVLPNLKWLIPLALTPDEIEIPAFRYL